MHTVLSRDGTKIAYDRTGSGPALILVGGAFGYRRFPGMVKLAGLLAERHTVYSYDRRGRGDSEDNGRGKGAADAVAREIEDLNAVIAEAGGSAFVYGLSSGAVLALQAAARGAAIGKLALHEPPFVVEPGDPLPPVDFAERVNELVRADRRDDLIRYFMVEGMKAPSFVPFMLRLMPGVWKRLAAVAPTLAYDAALLGGYLGGKPLDGKPWSAVAMPTLVLEGTESPASLRHAAKALADVLPNAELLSRKGLGHTKKLDAPRIARELNDFFTQKPNPNQEEITYAIHVHR